MEELENIKKIFWHELGHLCVDIVRAEKIEGVIVSKVKVSWDKEFKWKGHVETLPEHEWYEIIKDNNKFTYPLMSLLSGCVFQTSYEQFFLDKNEIRFEDCFCKEGIGTYDYMDLNSFVLAFINHNKVNGTTKLAYFLLNEVAQYYGNEVLKKVDLFHSLKEVVDIQAQIIFDDFHKKGRPDCYSYYIRNQELKDLIEKITPIIYKHGFIGVLAEISEKIEKEIESYQVT
jgi:hypothetical protein